MKTEKNKSTVPKTKILIAEDSPTQSIQIKHLLESHHYKVLVTQNGKEAMDRLTKNKPSLIISDIVMPGINGFELCKNIKSNKNTEDIPVVLLTRLSDTEEIIKGLSCGADSFITKPYNEEYLLSHIEKILSVKNEVAHKKVSFGTQILFKGKKRFIQAEQQNVVKLLIDIYEGAIEQNERLVQTEEELRSLNERLESLVNERTSDLTAEIKLSNQIAERLKESEEIFSQFMQNCPIYVFFKDTSIRSLRLSRNYEQMLGKPLEELLGKTMGELFPSDFARKMIEDDIRILKEGKQVTIDEELDGKYYTTVKFPIYQNGKPHYLAGYTIDITERVHAEMERRKLSRAVEQSPSSIVITDTYGNIEYVNPKFCEITGYLKDELIGKNPRILSSGEMSKEAYKVLWDTIASGKEWKGEFHNKKKNGEFYWERSSISPVKNTKDEITHFLGVKEDITREKKIEQKLVESERRYRELFLNNPVPMWIFDSGSLEFIEVNDSAVFNYGYSREEFSAMTLKEILLSEDVPRLVERMNTIEDNVLQSKSWRHRKKDGTVIHVDVNSHALPGKLGRKIRLGMAIDITESVKAAETLKLAKEKAEASDKLKTTFLNNISHEVRTPLNGILGFAEIMSQKDLSAKDKDISLSMLYESSDRLLNTITNYMDISLITSGNMNTYKKDFLPGHALRELFGKYQTICRTRNIELFLKIPEQSDKLSVNSDSEIIKKIISHLLNNAIKFTEKGNIQYGYNIEKNELEFFVSDTGTGISKESITRIFERFEKEDRELVRLTEGSGLGLSISKGMVEILGGKIWVESEIGKGSTFFFTIPDVKKSEDHLSLSTAREHKKFKSSASILIAEDDESNFFYINTLLKDKTKSTIIHASNGRDAIEKFLENPDIGLVLMDIKMPVMDGLEATRQIKAINRNIPVIAITAYAMAGDETRILDVGCDYCLTKPINKELLLEKIAEFIST